MKVIVKGFPGEGKTKVIEIIMYHLKENGYLTGLVEHGYLEGQEAYSVEVEKKKAGMKC